MMIALRRRPARTGDSTVPMLGVVRALRPPADLHSLLAEIRMMLAERRAELLAKLDEG